MPARGQPGNEIELLKVNTPAYFFDLEIATFL